jgi:hypothetical protein
MYRDRLADEAPAACVEMDDLMRTFGQDWICEALLHPDLDDHLTTAEIAEQADVSEDAVRQWVARWPLEYRARNEAGRKLSRWGDVIDHQRQQRQRKLKNRT